MKGIIKLYIESIKIWRRFNKLHKINKSLLKEYDNINRVDINLRVEFLNTIKFLNNYERQLLNEMEEMIK